MKKLQKKKQFMFPLWNIYFTFKEQLILFGFVLLGFIIRAINALYIPLWRDEIYIFFTSRENSLWSLVTQQHWDTAHPPLHSILLHFWQMVSFHPFMLRLPSLLASFLILYLIPILAIKITKNHKYFPFLFLFLFSLSHPQISMNMVVRPYPFVILLTVISLILFLSMLNTNIESKKYIMPFGFVNIIMFFLDYSAIWLFGAYFFFLLVHFLIYKSKPHLGYVFKGFLLSILCGLTVLPFLLGNLHTSLDLERFIEPIRYTRGTLSQGKTMYLYIRRKEKKVSIFNASFNKLDEASIPSDPFPKNKIYVGYNLSPLSLLIIKDYSVCLINSENSSHIKLNSNCNFHKINTPLVGNISGDISRNIRSVFFDKYSILINFGKKDWEVYLYRKDITLTKNQDVLFKINMSSVYTLNPPGINIFGKLQSDNILWWKDIRRFTIFPSEGQYRISYYDGKNQQGEYIFGDKGPLEKFSGALLFFSGFTNITDSYISLLLMTSLIVLSQLTNLLLINRKNHQLLLMFLLFLTPLTCSLFISYFFVPIFLGRNLHLVNLSYICGLSLFISLLLKIKMKTKFLQLFPHLLGYIGIALYIFIFVLQFPYLHYVDPPYDITKIMNIIEKSPFPKKHIILGNNDHYFPLFRYALLFSKKIYELPVSTLEFLEKDGKRIKALEKYGKMNTDLFFIQFGLSVEENGDDFSKISKLLDCKLKQVKIPYVFFAQCQ